MSVRAPERESDLWVDVDVDERLDESVPIAEPGRVRRLAGRRCRRRLGWLSLALALLVGASAAVVFVRSREGGPPSDPGGPSAFSSSLAWGVRTGSAAHLAVVAVPSNRRPVVVAIPPGVLVDVPAGPRTTEGAVSAPGVLHAVAQAAVGGAVEHHLITGGDDLVRMVDGLGGIQIHAEAAFLVNGRSFGPGLTRVSGEGALAYLEQAPELDRTGRWMGVLTGMLSVSGDEDRWEAPPGSSDDLEMARQILAAAYRPLVMELPTTPGSEVVMPDARAVEELVRLRMGDAVGPLVRVVVLNGNGEPGMAGSVGSALAPAGFRVVAAHNARSFDEERTLIVADGAVELAAARRVREMLGVGKVYVGDRPSGIADITIVVGKDYRPA